MVRACSTGFTPKSLAPRSSLVYMISKFGCNLHRELCVYNFRKTTRDVLEEMWEEEQECEDGPPDMPDFSKVPDFPSSDDEGAIQPRV